MDPYQQFVFTRTYARYLWDEGRRETWEETVQRYIDWMLKNPIIPEKVRRKSHEKILKQEVMPSMRALWAAGPAADRNNAVLYNCAYTPIDSLTSFTEILYLLMCGCGVGFSVEQRYVDQLPIVKLPKNIPTIAFVVPDSREGWAEALLIGLDCWWHGRDCFFDYSRLRPLGAPLKTMGGRSSGGKVLETLLQYCRELVTKAQGRRLHPIECHDLVCAIASIVVVGGTRRSALMSISDLTDTSLQTAKVPPYPQERGGANNSAAYYQRPQMRDFLDEWVTLAKSGTGERGIANIGAVQRCAPHRRKGKLIAGLNPCGEVALRARQFCNLTEVVIRPDDDFEALRDKITTAVWLGVIQACHTNFGNLPAAWADNCQEERLCGVSLTGQLDHPDLLTEEVLRLSRQHAVSVARRAARVLGVATPAAVTCVKPSGTVSKLVDCSAGMHPRWANYYIQSTQISTADPLFLLLRDQGVPFLRFDETPQVAILQFPIASPKGAITRHDLSVVEQLEHYRKITENWCEHNASATIYVAKDEWLRVASWIWDNWDLVRGLSFYPKEEDQSSYLWRPWEEITEDKYCELVEAFPAIDFTRLTDYESEDLTEGARELACSGGQCEI